LGEEYFEVPNLVKYSVVPTGGKGRGVTIADPWMGVLSPLHSVTYDRISTRPWLLRGEAKPGRFRSFTRKAGEVFVSGDYESATDNLRVEVALAILDVMESNSTRVPSTVWETARRFLHCRVLYPDLSVPMQTEGQLMGNLMCFPLLCIQNYVAFRWVFSDSVPVKINGDDIVFRSSRSDYERWASFVGSVGLTLSRGKTLVSDHFFSLNSSFFWSRPARPPRPVPVTRVSCFGKKFEDWGSLAGSFRSFLKGFGGEARFLGEVFFLRRFRRRILQAGRSVVRGLGIPASERALRAAGLWRRECWYFDSVPDSEDQLPPSPCRLKWGAIPPGWERVPISSVRLTGAAPRFVAEGQAGVPALKPPDVSALQKAFWSELIARTWLESPTRGTLEAEYWLSVIRSGKEGLWRAWRRPPDPKFLRPGFAKMMALVPKKRVTRSSFDKFVAKPREPMVWAPVVLDRREESGVVWNYTVQELVDYEVGPQAYNLCPPPESYSWDPKYSLGHR
jgi:hypothetical protein